MFLIWSDLKVDELSHGMVSVLSQGWEREMGLVRCEFVQGCRDLSEDYC